MADDIRSFNTAQEFDSPEKVAAHIDRAMGENDPATIANAIGEVVRAKGMAALAESADLSRNSLYKSLCAKGNPSLATLTKVVKALGLKLSVVPASD